MVDDRLARIERLVNMTADAVLYLGGKMSAVTDSITALETKLTELENALAVLAGRAASATLLQTETQNDAQRMAALVQRIDQLQAQVVAATAG